MEVGVAEEMDADASWGVGDSVSRILTVHVGAEVFVCVGDVDALPVSDDVRVLVGLCAVLVALVVSPPQWTALNDFVVEGELVAVTVSISINRIAELAPL